MARKSKNGLVKAAKGRIREAKRKAGPALKSGVKIARKIARVALDTPVIRKKLEKGAKLGKAYVKSTVAAKCPECAEAFELAKKSKEIQKIIESGAMRLRETCPECHEIVELVVKA